MLSLKKKIGVFIPTYNRPDLIRSSILQFTAQTILPDVIAVHQNGNSESYESIINDISWSFKIKWIHTENKIRQHEWYRIPLQYLIENKCDLFFWVDHDDMYSSNHIENAIEELREYDFRISETADFIAINKNKFKICGPRQFKMHAPKGMSSSMAFNRKFAIELEKDLLEDRKHMYSDGVVAKKVMPKFKCFSSKNITTKYICRPGSETSKQWVEGILKNS